LNQIILKAFAKINIGLRVLRSRPDGYHDIETLLQNVSLYDRITLEKGKITEIRGTSAQIPTDGANICWQAIELLQQETGRELNCRITIEKNVPVGAGLGGGSSDGAATLWGANRLWGLGLPIADLERLALGLGSDVPFFLRGGSALAQGRGEILSTVDLSIREPILIIYPNFPVSTAWAYKNVSFDLTNSRQTVIFPKFLQRPITYGFWRQHLRNDFEQVVFSRYPSLAEAKQKFYRLGALYAGLSGSGSVLYGIFGDQSQAEKAADLCPREYRAFLTRVVNRGFQRLSVS